MPVPSTAADLSTTAASNSPAGADAIGTSLDDYLRSIQAIIKQQDSKGSDIASATTIDVPAAGKYFVVTGTTTIAGISDDWNGRSVILKFSGVLQLTHSSSFILPTTANITTAAGDCLVAINESTGVWRVVVYQRADGTANIANGTITNAKLASDVFSSVHTWSAAQTFSSGVSVTGGTLGFGTGVGGTVTQLTSKTTAVTLNKSVGTIVTNAAALAANTTVTFTFNNTVIAAEDQVLITIYRGGIAASANYQAWADAGTGSSFVNLRNVSAGSLSEAVTLNFAVIKGVTA